MTNKKGDVIESHRTCTRLQKSSHVHTSFFIFSCGLHAGGHAALNFLLAHIRSSKCRSPFRRPAWLLSLSHPNGVRLYGKMICLGLPC